MQTIIFTVFAFMLFFFLMAIGLIFRGKVLKGTCGGLNALFGKGSCEVCDKKVEECKYAKNS
jgi:hypothetical protein